ncbi:MAG: glycosyltransferase family 10 domain-containing protein [Chitinophagaceae bacterium]
MGLRSFLFPKKVHTTQINPLYKASNLWPGGSAHSDFWLFRFLQHNQLLQYPVHIFSVFGHVPSLLPNEINFFFTGENVHYKTFKKYENNAINIADAAIGFDYIQATNYTRFPLWLMYLFPPDATFETVEKIINQYNFSENAIKRPTKFAMIASHDKRAGKRKKIIRFIEKNFGSVACAGKLLNNTDVLKRRYNDQKIDYLQTVCFNICPENSNYSGYVTEKIFEAIQAGCIPIYWGSNNLPEPTILNQDAIVFFDAENKNNQLIDKINWFVEQKNIHEIPRFQKDAAKHIWQMMLNLKELMQSAIDVKNAVV